MARSTYMAVRLRLNLVLNPSTLRCNVPECRPVSNSNLVAISHHRTFMNSRLRQHAASSPNGENGSLDNPQDPLDELTGLRAV